MCRDAVDHNGRIDACGVDRRAVPIDKIDQRVMKVVQIRLERFGGLPSVRWSAGATVVTANVWTATVG